VDNPTGAGGNGSSAANTGGGGGAGATGGQGGAGYSGAAGGAGGDAANKRGADGGMDTGAGGGGGAHGFVGSALPTSAASGGAGGTGGSGNNSSSQYGGGGGAGGYGAVVTGSGDLGVLSSILVGGSGGAGGQAWARGGNGGSGGIGLLFTTSSAMTVAIDARVQGGNGGSGGTSNLSPDKGSGGGAGGAGLVLTTPGAVALTVNSMVLGGKGGNGGSGNRASDGGNGGIGLRLTAPSAATVTINATVRGGNGGSRNAGGAGGMNGDGGAGLVGQNLTVVMGAGGSIIGGLAGDGRPANAIIFTGGVNTLRFANATAALTGNIDVTGSLSFDQSGDTTVANAITGSGALIKSGAGTITLGGTNSYSGGTTLLGGVLSVSADANLGAASGNLALDRGTLQYGAGFAIDRQVTLGNSNGTFDTNGYNAALRGAIGGAGALIKTGAGTLTLSNTNTYSGGTVINAGTVAISSDANLGSAGKVTFNGGTLQLLGGVSSGRSMTFNAAGGTIDTMGNVASLSGSLSGAGGLTKIGSGTLVLKGASTYLGPTSINAGTLAGGAADAFSAASMFTVSGNAILDIGGFDQTVGGLAGSGSVTNSGALAATLAVGANNANTTFSGAIVDGTTPLSLTKTGTGALILTGSNSYSGDTTVSGGTLGGSGNVGSGAGSTVTIAENGTLTPGNSISALKIDGDLVFASGSIFAVEVDPQGTASDKVTVTGTATLGGSVVHVGAGGNYKPFSRYRILSAAGGLDGSFGAVSSDFAFLTPDLVYDPNDVYLTLTRNDIDFASKARSRNQRAVAGSVDALGMGNALYDAVAVLPDDAGLIQASFDQLSGEVQATARGVLLADSRFLRDAISRRIGAAFGGVGAAALPVMAYGEGGIELAPATTDRLALWSQAFGSWGAEQGDGNAAGISRSLRGFLAGGDVALDDTWRLGLLAGYSHDSFTSDGFGASGSSDNYHLGLYGGGRWGSFGLSGGAAYSFSRIDTARTVAFPGFADNLSARYDAGTAQLFGEAAYRINAAAAAFEPFANLAYVGAHSGGFAEQGGAAALHSGSSTTDTTFTTLGLRAQADFALGGAELTARGFVGWCHAFGDVTPKASLAFAGGEAFTVAGTPLARDAALLEAGLDLRLTPAATLGLAYTGQLAARGHDNGFRADLNVRF
jgi:outer membrane autotransporter protein